MGNADHRPSVVTSPFLYRVLKPFGSRCASQNLDQSRDPNRGVHVMNSQRAWSPRHLLRRSRTTSGLQPRGFLKIPAGGGGFAVLTPGLFLPGKNRPGLQNETCLRHSEFDAHAILSCISSYCFYRIQMNFKEIHICVLRHVSEKRLVGRFKMESIPKTPSPNSDQRRDSNRGVHGKAHKRVWPPLLSFRRSQTNLRIMIL